MIFSGIELLGYQIVLPTSVAFSPGKPESLEWFADACDIVADLLEHGIEVENVKHSFELAYYVAGKTICSFSVQCFVDFFKKFRMVVLTFSS